jgi:hypothetical protein
MKSVRGVAIAACLSSACAGPLRSLASNPGCAQLASWAQEKAGDKPARPSESSAVEDSQEAAACFHQKGDDKSARAALLIGLTQRAAEAGASAGSFDDSLARALAALALSARAAHEPQTFESAQKVLEGMHVALDLNDGDRTAAGGAGEAVSMIDGNCFFCAHADVYGAQDREHVELLGGFAGVPYCKRDDGREQFLLSTRLLADGEQSPRQKFADAIRRRARRIDDATPAMLAQRKPGPEEDLSTDAPLFRLTLRGFSYGLVDGEVRLPVKSDAGEIIVRFPSKLLQRAGRDHRFVAPADGVDAVVRYEGLDDGRPVYRTVILRHEDGVAEGP